MTVLVTGSLHLDVVLRAPHLPALDETVTGTSVDYVFGGKGGNQAVAAARMGSTVDFVGRAGTDRFGDMIRDTLQSSGVRLDQLQLDPGASGMSAAILNAQGDYGAVIVSAANLNIKSDPIYVPKGTTVVLLQNEVPEAVNLAVAEKARATGAQVWLNAAPARPVSDGLAEWVDLLIVNRVEAEFHDAQGRFAQCLTTLGADGVSLHGRHYPGYKVDMVSAHGAGDMFVGALAAQIDAGANMVDAIDFAQAAAAQHVASGLADRAHLTPDTVTGFLAAQDKR